MTTDELALYGEPLLSTLPKVAKTPEPKSPYIGGDMKIVRLPRPSFSLVLSFGPLPRL